MKENYFSVMPIYSWQQAVWQQLQQSRARLPHALLLHGRQGVGKLLFAKSLSQSLLCENPDSQGYACQTCTSCHWLSEDAHPDLRVLTPEQEASVEEGAEATKKKAKQKTNIAIAQIRALADFINLTSHRPNGRKIVLIHPAESLNTASANALLKMLEEPANNVIFILVAHQIHQLLPTILSRCQHVAMPIPAAEASVKWLKTQGVNQAETALSYFSDSPISVFEQHADMSVFTEIWQQLAQGKSLEPSAAANKLLALNAEAGINALQKWLYDLVAIKSACPVRYHTASTQPLQQLASKVNLNTVFEFQKKVLALKKLALHPLNHELQMTCLMVEYTKLF